MDESDNEDISRDSSKAAKIAFNDGYREGITDGKDKIMQESFDSGYSLGLQIGKAMGFYNGLLGSISNNDHVLSTNCKELVDISKTDVLLNESSKENCKMCKDPKLLNALNKTIEETQKNHNGNIIQKVVEKYSPILNEVGIEDSDLIKTFNVDNIKTINT